MKLECLRVVHLPKGPSQDLSVGARISAALPGMFHLDSCQRQLWACWDFELEESELPGFSGFDIFEGADAYRFLLRVAVGLESQILGETDIFGQLKEAWRKTDGDADMGSLMQRLFEDTKDIRSRYMQNLGGASYGSLVRMMLKQSPGPRLLVGAGQLAQSVAPYLLDEELWILNRSVDSLAALQAELLNRAASQGAPLPRLRVISAAEESMAWQTAASVVVCIPMDAAPGAPQDLERAAWRAGKPGPVIHLGGHREGAAAWAGVAGFEALDDLFALQKVQGDVRMTQVRQAARACDEKAKLRTLGTSVTLPHGWEDLALFA